MRVEITVTARDAETWEVAYAWPGCRSGATHDAPAARAAVADAEPAPPEGDPNLALADGAAAMALRIHERRELEPDDGVGLGAFLFTALIGAETWAAIVATAAPRRRARLRAAL